jgi:hypothetical protein
MIGPKLTDGDWSEQLNQHLDSPIPSRCTVRTGHNVKIPTVELWYSRKLVLISLFAGWASVRSASLAIIRDGKCSATSLYRHWPAQTRCKESGCTTCHRYVRCRASINSSSSRWINHRSLHATLYEAAGGARRSHETLLPTWIHLEISVAIWMSDQSIQVCMKLWFCMKLRPSNFWHRKNFHFARDVVDKTKHIQLWLDLDANADIDKH